MNKRMVLNTLGTIIALEAALLLLPLGTALIYAEWTTALAFAVTAAGAALLGFGLKLVTRGCDKIIFAREGFVITALAWILFCAIGAVPFVVSGEIPSYIDAFFETVSGITTTGASILTNVEALSHGALFWRSFTHWIGGMGVLVLLMAIFPDSEGRSIHIMRAEMPGPVVDKIVPRIKDTAKILYLIYVAMTALETIFLLCGGVNLFESLLYSFGTAGTGGFGLHGDSIGGYSPYVQWVITIFMLLFGVNFNLYYFLLIRRFREAAKNEELWIYVGIVVVSAGLIVWNVLPLFTAVGDAIRHAFFQVAAIITTTGYSTVDFALWPKLSKCIILLLMFVGGCAGSTAGGLKLSRVIILCKTVRRELKKLLHPRTVTSVKFAGKPLELSVCHSVTTYFAFYMLLLAVITFLVCLEPFDFETNFSAAVSCFNNVGPGLSAVGPMAGYSIYSPFTKVLLSLAMLLGRLEIYPLILTFMPSTWKRR